MASPSPAATILLLLLFLHITLTISSSTTTAPASKSQKTQLLSKRSVIDAGEDGGENHKPTALKNKTFLATKNQTKFLKPKKANSTTTTTSIAAGSKTTSTAKIKLGKSLNATLKTSNSTTKIKPSKSLNATQKASNTTKPLKTIKLIKSNATKSSKDQLKSPSSASNSTKSSKKSVFDTPIVKNKNTSATKAPKQQQPTNPPPAKKPTKPKAKPEESMAWMEEEDDTDLISDFRGLPSRLLPDLERLSITSKAYIFAANRGIAEGVKPYVGKSFASKVAPVLSSLFLALPLLLLTLLFRRLRAYLSLHRLLLFIQAYLAIYFATLAVTALATGLEPLRFFYATSPGSYTWTQAGQTMGYLVYLVLQLADLVAVFSSGGKDAGGGGGGASARTLALAQMVIGLAVGMHYYAAVFHRAVSGEAPRANWRVHAVYAACFLVICACARAERRKKAYYEGGEDGKNN